MMDMTSTSSGTLAGTSELDHKIKQINTTILDMPIKRPHKLSGATMTHQSYVLVEVETAGGLVGFGEGVTPGGPWWSGESVETIKALVDHHLAPALLDMNGLNVNAARMRMNAVASRSPFAKAAVEIALHDLAGKIAGMPLHQMFGGRLRHGIGLRWALASGDLERDIAEARQIMSDGLAYAFKIKGGTKSPADDIAHCRAIRTALGDEVSLQIDLNSVWDLSTALTYGPPLMELLDYLEQPIEGWNLRGLAQLRANGIRVMADESLYTAQDAFRLAELQAVDYFALKTMKSAGLSELRTIANIASTAGIACYAGTFMESSIGIAAHLHMAETLPAITEGGELFGGLWLTNDISRNGVIYKDGAVFAPEGAGHGVIPDPDVIQDFARR